jgi:hypothetical protein
MTTVIVLALPLFVADLVGEGVSDGEAGVGLVSGL